MGGHAPFGRSPTKNAFLVARPAIVAGSSQEQTGRTSSCWSVKAHPWQGTSC